MDANTTEARRRGPRPFAWIAAFIVLAIIVVVVRLATRHRSRAAPPNATSDPTTLTPRALAAITNSNSNEKVSPGPFGTAPGVYSYELASCGTNTDAPNSHAKGALADAMAECASLAGYSGDAPCLGVMLSGNAGDASWVNCYAMLEGFSPAYRLATPMALYDTNAPESLLPQTLAEALADGLPVARGPFGAAPDTYSYAPNTCGDLAGADNSHSAGALADAVAECGSAAGYSGGQPCLGVALAGGEWVNCYTLGGPDPLGVGVLPAYQLAAPMPNAADPGSNAAAGVLILVTQQVLSGGSWATGGGTDYGLAAGTGFAAVAPLGAVAADATLDAAVDACQLANTQSTSGAVACYGVVPRADGWYFSAAAAQPSAPQTPAFTLADPAVSYNYSQADAILDMQANGGVPAGSWTTPGGTSYSTRTGSAYNTLIYSSLPGTSGVTALGAALDACASMNSQGTQCFGVLATSLGWQGIASVLPGEDDASFLLDLGD